jgi:hypothetical protein
VYKEFMEVKQDAILTVKERIAKAKGFFDLRDSYKDVFEKYVKILSGDKKEAYEKMKKDYPDISKIPESLFIGKDKDKSKGMEV